MKEWITFSISKRQNSLEFRNASSLIAAIFNMRTDQESRTVWNQKIAFPWPEAQDTTTLVGVWHSTGSISCSSLSWWFLLYYSRSIQNWWKPGLVCQIAPKVKESWTEAAQEPELIWRKRDRVTQYLSPLTELFQLYGELLTLVETDQGCCWYSGVVTVVTGQFPALFFKTNGSLETGSQLFKHLTSRLGFLSSGWMSACLKDAGTGLGLGKQEWILI